MRDLARRLLTATRSESDRKNHEAVVALEKFRIALAKLAGMDGFVSLLRRALMLAKEELPSLQSVKVGADGRLEGFDEFIAQSGDDAGNRAAVAITTHLLQLLVTFIGEPLTLTIVRAAWSNLSLNEDGSTTEST